MFLNKERKTRYRPVGVPTDMEQKHESCDFWLLNVLLLWILREFIQKVAQKIYSAFYFQNT